MKDGSRLLAAGDLLPGSVIRNKYRIVAEIGRGGMAIVYRATHINLREDRALKIIKHEHSSDTAFVDRFITEALLTCQIDHHNVVRVYDTDETEDGQRFLVMEYVPGESLRSILQKEGRIAPLRCLHIAG